MLAEKLGLSHQALFDVASTSSGQCWSLTTYCPVPGPGADLARQPRLQAGLRRGADAEGPEAGAGGRATASGASTPLGAQAAQLYARFNENGHGRDDFSAIIRYVRGHAGVSRARNLTLGEEFSTTGKF